MSAGAELDTPIVAKLDAGLAVVGCDGTRHTTANGPAHVAVTLPVAGFVSPKVLELVE